VGHVSSGSNWSWVESGESRGLCMGQVFSGYNKSWVKCPVGQMGRGSCSVGHMGRGSSVQWVTCVVGRGSCSRFATPGGKDSIQF